MPITLPTTSRRRWMQQATAAGFASLAAKLPAAELPEQLWVLFSDPHIAEDEKAIAREVCMAENLTRCVNQVLKIGQKPFGVIVNGDCALLDGKTEDHPGPLHPRQSRQPPKFHQCRPPARPAECGTPGARGG